MTISWGNANPQEQQEEAVILNPRDVVNRRLLVRPVEYITSMQTKARNDPTDAIKMDIVVLDEPSGPARFNGALWFNGNLIGLFKKQLGKPFVGFIYQEPVPGTAWKKFMWASLDTDQATMAAAESWIRNNPDYLDPLPEPRPMQPQGGFNRDGSPQSHHEQGPPPAWATGPQGPPPMPTRALPPAPPSWSPAPVSAMPVSVTPVSPAVEPLSQESVVERLKRQAGIDNPPF